MSTDEAWPMPISPYTMRRHLAGDHDLELWGTAWMELAKIHDDAHRGGADHVHEKGG